MLDGGTEKQMQGVTESHAEEIAITARQGHKKDGRGAVVVKVDPDTKECNITWRPLSEMKKRKLRRLALNYDPNVEDLIVILPIRQLEGRGWLSRTVLREP